MASVKLASSRSRVPGPLIQQYAEGEAESLGDSVREDLARNLKERNLQFRYKAVENVMAPLIHQVTSLTEFKPPSLSDKDTESFILHRRQFGSPHKLVQLVDKAVRNFVSVGEDIAAENPEFKEEMLLCCEEMRAKGEALHTLGSVFIQDTSKPDKRVSTVRAARDLLFSVTRLMVVADIIDVNNVLNASAKIEEKLKALLSVKNEGDLMNIMQECTTSISHITQTATLHLSEMKSKTSLQMLSVAQTELNRAGLMLVSASKAFLQNPKIKAAEENREVIIEGMLRSLKTLSLLASGDDPFGTEKNQMAARFQPGELGASFESLETTLSEVSQGKAVTLEVGASLRRELGVILKASSDLAASKYTRDGRQHVIISHSGELKTSLQALVATGKGKGRKEEEEEEEEERRREILKQTKGVSVALKQELHRASVEHLSDAFADVLTPLNMLMRAAQDGDRRRVEKKAEFFQEHAHRMLKAASIMCSLSKDTNKIQMVKMAARHVQALVSQVVKAAQTLVVQPRSSVLQKNMSLFADGWMENVTLLANSVDAIAPLLDFLVATEAHLHDDSQALMEAVTEKNRVHYEVTVHLVVGRCGHVAHIIKAEMKEDQDRYSSEQRDDIAGRVHRLEAKSLVMFRDTVSKARDKFNEIHSETECQRALQDATEKVKEDVRELCRQILSTRPPTEQQPQDLEQILHTPHPQTPTTPSLMSQASSTSMDSLALSTPRKFQRTPQYSQVFGTEDSAKSVMSQLSMEEKAQLAKATAGITAQRAEVESEATKWDSENDIVLLAKEMCMMMMDMSDFTRGIGRLRSIVDLVITARDMVRAGEYLCDLSRLVADQCPDTKSRSDLYAYMGRIKLHCQQLKITSTVNSEQTSRETVDSASVLITAAKNLMTAAVDTVKTSYVASVAIARQHGGSMPDQFTAWRLTLPKKKNLEHTPEAKKDTLIHQLGQFKPDRTKSQML